MILSDRDLKSAIATGQLGIDPFDPACVQPCSIDLHLGTQFQIVAAREMYRDGTTRTAYLDPADPESTQYIGYGVAEREEVWLLPGVVTLGVTHERIRLGAEHAGQLAGRSSIGRLGVQVHITAGFIDAGYEGHPTLELVNLNAVPLKLYAGMRIAQLQVMRLTSAVEHLYRGHYQHDAAPQPSRLAASFADGSVWARAEQVVHG
jgi:dCTP deaminase